MKRIYFYFLILVLFVLAGCGSKVNIVFETNGGTAVEAITNKDDFDPNNLPTTSKEGYEFGGWFLDQEFTKGLGKEIPDNLEFTLYAKWIPMDIDYKVEYYLENFDGTYELEETLNLKGAYDKTVNGEVKNFDGFTLNQSRSKQSTKIKTTDNEVLKMYYDRNSYTISIDENGGNDIPDLTLKYGADVEIVDPTRVGYEFYGWDTTLYTMPARNVTIKAIWTPLIVEYKIQIYYENADDDGYTMFSEENKTALAGSTVAYQYNQGDPEPFVFFNDHPNDVIEAIVLGDGSTVLKAYFKRRLINVEFNFYEGKEPIVKQYKYGASNYLEASGDRIGHEFISWLDNEGTAKDTVPFTQLDDYKLYGNWKKLSYTITFETNANISVTSISALYDTDITAPTNPIRQGYTFLGWYLEDNYTTAYIFSKMEARSFTLYAKWEGLPYTMEFESNGGSVVNSINEAIDTDITKPIPSKDGYNFVNWYTDSSLTKVFSNWKMPYNGVKLYAKWEAKTFNIVFNTNGGSPLAAITKKYLEEVFAPLNNPTKDGFIFDGYYKDENFEEEFIFNVMPLNGATVYVKWIDINDLTSIANVLRQDLGSTVTVSGYIFGILNDSYYGYYLYDETGYIYIHAPQSNIEIGQLVSVTGNLSNNARVTNVTDVLIESAGNTLKTPVNAEILALYTSVHEINNYYKFYSLSGLLKQINDKFVLYDYINDVEIIVDHRSVNYDSLSLYINKFVEVEVAYNKPDYTITVFDIAEVSDDAVNLQFLKDYIYKQYNNQNYASGIDFEIPSTDEFGINSIITYSATGDNASFYDSVNKKFNEVTRNLSITFTINLTVGNITEDFNVIVYVGDIDYVTVSEFYSGEDDKFYLLNVIVIMSINGYLSIVKDDTGYLFLSDLTSVAIGDDIIINAIKYDGMEYISATLVEIKAKEVDLNLSPTVLTPEEFNTSVENKTVYTGDYIELTGFITSSDEDLTILFTCGDKVYHIISLDYMSRYILNDYTDYLVKIRVYALSNGEDILLLFANTRGDISYPDLTDQEAVNELYSLFSRLFENRNFYPYDTFEIPSCDLVYGVEIEYEFSESSKEYYINNKFINVTTSIPIEISFRLTKNEVVQEFVYNTSLVPLQVTLSSNLRFVDDYTTVFVEGLVVFHSYEYIIIKDAEGLIRYDYSDINAYVGDYVLLSGNKYTYNAEVILYESNYPIVLEIYSRGNDVSLNPEDISINKLYQLSSIEDNITKFITVTGELTKDGGWYTLSDGINTIRIDCVDDYTGYKLEEHIGKIITLNCFLGYYRNDLWYVYYVGNNITVNELTDTEKIAKIKDFILNNYDGSKEYEDGLFTLITLFSQYDGIVSYSSTSPIISIEDGYVLTDYVDVSTIVTISATITVGDLIQTIDFEVTILEDSDDNEILVTPIINVFALENESTVRIIGKIIANFVVNGEFYYLVQDDTGVIYIRLPDNSYIYRSYVGSIVDVYATKEEDMGRIYLKASSINYGGTTTVNIDFINTSFASIYNMNPYDMSNIGMPLEITGRITNGGYFITDGFNNCRLAYAYFDYSKLNSFDEYNVTLKAYYFGYNEDIDEIILVYSDSYLYYPSIVLAEYTALEKVQKAKSVIIDNFDYYNYIKYDSSLVIELPMKHDKFTDCEYVYSVLGDTGSYIENNRLYFANLHRDYSVTLQIDIVCEDVSETIEVIFNVEGYELNTLDELFLYEPGTKEINLIGQVILVTNNYLYILIDNKVYFLDKAGDYYDINNGDSVHIKGKKSIIDGKVDYSYQITIEQTDYISISEPLIISKTITEFYNDLLLGLNLKGNIYTVTGILREDIDTDMYYLEDGDNRIYIRHYEEYYEPRSTRDFHERNEYLDELVTCYLLYPDKYVYGDHLLFDLLEIEFVELSADEHLNHAIDDLKRDLEGRVFETYDYFIDVFRAKYFHDVYFEISVINPNDYRYFTDEYYNVGIVDQDVTIGFNITASNGTNSISFNVDINLKATHLSTINDVLNGVTDEYYLVEGIVQAFHQDYFIILKDDTGTIYIDSNYYGLDVKVGDKLQAFGRRTYYDWGSITPTLKCYELIKVIDSNNAVSNTPVEIDFEDILEIDYNNPSVFMQYVSITGKVVFTGNTWYPSYAIYDQVNDQELQYVLELEGQTYNEFNAMMNGLLGQEITITGWLIGFSSPYSKFSWYMIYDSHTVTY